MGTLSQRAVRSLSVVDGMTPELRACVHDFGLAIVDRFLQAGVKNPAQIRGIVLACWQNAGNGGPNRRSGFAADIDALLARQGFIPSSAALAALLHGSQIGIISVTPTHKMIDASIREAGKHGLLSKERKHMFRLQAALKTGFAEHWPEVWKP